MNKTNYDDFDKVFTYLHLFKASTKCQRNVNWKGSVQNYIRKRNINLSNTLIQLRNNKYRSRGFYTFTKVERGKPRVIRSNHISERVVQKTLCDYSLVPILRKKLIYDNGATLKHKGCLFVINRTKHFIRQIAKINQPIYYLSMDYHSYFENINHSILLNDIKHYYKDYRLFNLITYFVKCFGDKGLGLGSQISQICAIYYPHSIDNYIKHNAKHKYYTRYMDDSIIIDTSKTKLKKTLKNIQMLCNNIDIELNVKKTMISNNNKGCSYLKRHWKVNNKKLVVRPNKDSYYRMFRKLKIFVKWQMPISYIETSYQSWRSHFLKDNAKILVNKADIKYNKLKEIYL